MPLFTAADESPEDDFDAILHEDAGERTVVFICFIMYFFKIMYVPLTSLLVVGPNLKMFVCDMCISIW